MANKFLVDRIGEDCIRVYPEKQSEHAEQCDVKKSRVIMYDYGCENGFSITPTHIGPSKSGTIFKIKDFPCCTIHQSKTKFMIRLSFTKATCDDAERMIERDTHKWFDFLREYETKGN